MTFAGPHPVIWTLGAMMWGATAINVWRAGRNGIAFKLISIVPALIAFWLMASVFALEFAR